MASNLAEASSDNRESTDPLALSTIKIHSMALTIELLPDQEPLLRETMATVAIVLVSLVAVDEAPGASKTPSSVTMVSCPAKMATKCLPRPSS